MPANGRDFGRTQWPREAARNTALRKSLIDI
jgi:hypothetical protein